MFLPLRNVFRPEQSTPSEPMQFVDDVATLTATLQWPENVELKTPTLTPTTIKLFDDFFSSLERDQPKQSTFTTAQQSMVACSEVPLIDMPPAEQPEQRNESMSNLDDEAKKKIRRERNRLAAARCRKRRNDFINNLKQEKEYLEETKSKLIERKNLLRAQEQELRNILDFYTR